MVSQDLLVVSQYFLLGLLGCLVHGLCRCEFVVGTSHSRVHVIVAYGNKIFVV
jgi:hypothetical protein